jgi:hypothetical protein
VREHYDWAGGHQCACGKTIAPGPWCEKTMAGQVYDGARTPLLGEWAMVREHRGWAGGRLCKKTIAGRVGDGTRIPRPGA